MFDGTPELSAEQLALLRAADYIEEHGWRRYSLGNNGYSVCILGAIRLATLGDTGWHLTAAWQVQNLDAYNTMLAAKERVKKVIGKSNVAVWNDEYAGGKNHVIAVLRQAGEPTR